MFVHDGLVHKRFPVRAHHNTAAVRETVKSSQVGPLANVPFMKRVAAAHMLHHADKYAGKPFGMLLGPQVCRDSHPRPLCFPTSYLSTVAGASPHSWSSGRIGEVGVRFVTSNIAISFLPPRSAKISSSFVLRNWFQEHCSCSQHAFSFTFSSGADTPQEISRSVEAPSCPTHARMTTPLTLASWHIS